MSKDDTSAAIGSALMLLCTLMLATNALAVALSPMFAFFVDFPRDLRIQNACEMAAWGIAVLVVDRL